MIYDAIARIVTATLSFFGLVLQAPAEIDPPDPAEIPSPPPVNRGNTIHIDVKDSADVEIDVSGRDKEIIQDE